MRCISHKAEENNEFNMYPSYKDELTGLLNRRALIEQWTYFISSRSNTNLALLIVDIDRFKRFNELLGKQKADNMLAEISVRFNRLRNEFCEVFHYNGDEYVFILKYNMVKEVEEVANKIFHVLKDAVIVESRKN